MSKTTLMTLAAFTAVAIFSGLAKADGDTDTAGDGSQARTCAEATQAAWFHRQMERSDGDTSPDVPAAPECSHDDVAAIEESK
jgi:hypothetical protein